MEEYHHLARKAPKKKRCPKCNKLVGRKFSVFMVDSWGPVTLDHIASEPMTFNTRDELRKECKKRGVESGALL